jgi:hypothetical protein
VPPIILGIFTEMFYHIHLKKKLIFAVFFCCCFISIIFKPLSKVSSYSCPCKCLVQCNHLLHNLLKCNPFIFCLCLMSHLGPGFGNGCTSSGERVSLLVTETSCATGVLAKGRVSSWLGSSFSMTQNPHH